MPKHKASEVSEQQSAACLAVGLSKAKGISFLHPHVLLDGLFTHSQEQTWTWKASWESGSLLTIPESSYSAMLSHWPGLLKQVKPLGSEPRLIERPAVCRPHQHQEWNNARSRLVLGHRCCWMIRARFRRVRRFPPTGAKPTIHAGSSSRGRSSGPGPAPSAGTPSSSYYY